MLLIHYMPYQKIPYAVVFVISQAPSAAARAGHVLGRCVVVGTWEVTGATGSICSPTSPIDGKNAPKGEGEGEWRECIQKIYCVRSPSRLFASLGTAKAPSTQAPSVQRQPSSPHCRRALSLSTTESTLLPIHHAPASNGPVMHREAAVEGSHSGLSTMLRIPSARTPRR